MARQSSHRTAGKAAAQRLIDREAKLLSSRHRVDRERVLSILERTFKHSSWDSLFGRFSGVLEKGPSRLFDPSLHLALEYLSAEDALSLFEAGVEKLDERLSILDYLGDSTIPFYSLDELKEFTRAFTGYLERTRETILLTGDTQSTFHDLNWLSMQLKKLYYVKLADRISSKRVLTRHTPESTGIPSAEFPFYEMAVTSYWTDANGQDCSYDEAQFIEGLDRADARRLEEARSALFDLKKNILNELVISLDQGNQGSAWSRCLRLITSVITAEEADSTFGWTDGMRGLTFEPEMSSIPRPV